MNIAMQEISRIIVNEEFKEWIPPLSDEEYRQLEVNIISDGCRDPIVLWNDVIVDGHNRFKICNKHDILFESVDMEFDSANHAKIWMLDNQAGRRNLTDGWAYALKQEKKAELIEIGKVEMERKPNSALSTIDKPKPHNTRNEVAKELGWSTGKVAMADKVWKESTPEVKEEIKSGKVSFNQVYRDVKREENKAARVEKINEIAQGNEELDVSRTYPVIYADPPWQYEHSETDSRKIENHYPTMTLDAICAMNVNELAAKDSILFLWTTSPKLAEGMKVMESWGFKYTTCGIWDKQKKGLGYYFRQNHEILLVGKKGSIPTPEPKDRPDSIISIPKEKHSSKPLEFHKIIENMYPEFSRIELFCRNPQPNWEVWGNQSNG